MKDTNTTLVVGLLGVIIVALAAFLAIAISKTDPVVIIGFAGTILGGLFAFLRAGQAADEIAKAKKDIAASASVTTQAAQITTQAAATVQEIKVSVDGKMADLLEQTKLAASYSATLLERTRGEEKASNLAVSTGAALAAATAAPANPPTRIEKQIQSNSDAITELQRVGITQAATDPVPVVIIQPEDSPVPVIPVPVDMTVKADEGGTP